MNLLGCTQRHARRELGRLEQLLGTLANALFPLGLELLRRHKDRLLSWLTTIFITTTTITHQRSRRHDDIRGDRYVARLDAFLLGQFGVELLVEKLELRLLLDSRLLLALEQLLGRQRSLRALESLSGLGGDTGFLFFRLLFPKE